LDQRFAARVSRIESGQQWQAAGVICAQGVRRRRRLPLMQRPNVRFGMLMGAALGVAALAVGPAARVPPEQLAGLADSPAAMRMMSMIPGF
jgi:hypothetical protein